MIGLMIGCVSNIILDPLLIFGLGPFPALGIEGAALATGLGQVFNLVFYLIVYKIKPLQVQLSRSHLHPDMALAARLYSVGIPGALNLALPSVLVSALNGLLAAYSQSYVVILGIYYKLQTFLYLPASGIVQGMRPVIGYNYGAGEHKRVKKNLLCYALYEWCDHACRNDHLSDCSGTADRHVYHKSSDNCRRQNSTPNHLCRISDLFCIRHSMRCTGGALGRGTDLIDRLSLQIPDHYPSGSIYPESFLRSRWCMERFLDCGSADRRGILAYQQEGYRGIIP